MSKNIKTFADYMADDYRVSPAERERINAVKLPVPKLDEYSEYMAGLLLSL